MKFEIYKDRMGEHRWRLKHGNGQILAVSSEGYASKSGCVVTIESIKMESKSANTVLQETISSWK